MKSHKQFKKNICTANKTLIDSGLVVLTWGNVSGRDGDRMAIKPSGVNYSKLAPENIVVMSIDSGEKCEGELNPSSDSPTHLEIYRAFPSVKGVVHTHSPYATAWAQAGRSLPCLGTTHADTFCGEVPLCRQLSGEEVQNDYEANTGKAIVEHFRSENLDPLHIPGVLVPGHGPFVWGSNPESAVENAIVLEEVAKINFLSENLSNDCAELPEYILKKHFSRKHGPDAYYGQD